MVFTDPVHQVHNNENDYAWQFKGKQGTRIILVNTGRRRVNIIGVLNPLSFHGSCCRTPKIAQSDFEHST